MTEWWSQQTGVLIGAVGGGGLGGLGGILGALAGWLAPKGIGRLPILSLFWIFFLAGVCSLIGGVFAVTQSQPYHVYYPLLLIGGVLSFVMGGLIPVIRLRYRQAEQRKLDAEELRRG